MPTCRNPLEGIYAFKIMIAGTVWNFSKRVRLVPNDTNIVETILFGGKQSGIDLELKDALGIEGVEAVLAHNAAHYNKDAKAILSTAETLPSLTKHDHE